MKGNDKLESMVERRNELQMAMDAMTSTRIPWQETSYISFKHLNLLHQETQLFSINRAEIVSLSLTYQTNQECKVQTSKENIKLLQNPNCKTLQMDSQDGILMPL